MKLVIDKNKAGLTSKEFYEYLKTPVPSTSFTQEEADEIRKTLEDAHKELGGLGISATQLGIKKRACYIKFGDDELFSTPKPEALLERIIQIATKEGDLVLDFFAGSGTTAAVAHKMGRRWITIEQMDYVETITKVRLQKVLDGEQGGVSKNHKWQGGGSFVYFEMP